VVGGGGADVVVESTGVSALLATAVNCATRGGRITVPSLGTDEASLDPKRLTLFERSLIGSLGYRHDLPRVVAMVAAGVLDPGAIVGATVPLTQAGETMAEMARGLTGEIKVLVDPAG
jgi:(R,R)-butanediol dehydrogenase/meso-butanediol dehydrogenase/diacetyl reductase